MVQYSTEHNKSGLNAFIMETLGYSPCSEEFHFILKDILFACFKKKKKILEVYLILWKMAIKHQGILCPLFSHLNDKVRCGYDIWLKSRRANTNVSIVTIHYYTHYAIQINRDDVAIRA